VCATGLPLHEQVALNTVCHKNGIKYFGTQVFGFFGYIFTDLCKHSYVVDKPEKRGKEEVIVSTKKDSTFVDLETALQHTFQGTKTKRLKKTVPKLFFGIKVVDRFAQEAGKLPCADDLPRVQALRDTLMPELGADASLCTDADLAELVSSVGCELGPVAAIVGGVLAGELIKAASLKGEPHDNLVLFDGNEMSGRVLFLGNKA